MNNLGKKIKERRRELGLTQQDVACGTVTRNMICSIENGTAKPSLDTLLAIADKIDVPVAYLFDYSVSLPEYRTRENLPRIRKLFFDRKYKECESAIRSLSSQNDESAYLGALSSFYSGKEAVYLGNLNTASACFDKAEEYAGKTKYPTERIKAMISIYRPVIRNIKSPLLELDDTPYLDYMADGMDLDFYHFLKQTPNHEFKDEVLRLYSDARGFMKQKRYELALPVLLEIEERKTENYRAPVILSVYTDIETCYRELCDFEKAYRYSTKRLSLMEYFHS